MVDYYTTWQYLKFNSSDFWNSSSFSITWPLNFRPNHIWQVIFSSLCDLYQTWYTGSTWWEMHSGMTLTRIQGQGLGHRDQIVTKSPKFKVYLFRQNSLNLKTDVRLLHYRTNLKFHRSDFWNSSSFFVTWPLNFGPNHIWQVIFLSLCDLCQTWYTGSTRWEMHNGMTLTRIQGQGHRDPKVAKSTKLRQAVSHHKMRRKIGLLLHKVRFELQFCANQYFWYLI